MYYILQQDSKNAIEKQKSISMFLLFLLFLDSCVLKKNLVIYYLVINYTCGPRGVWYKEVNHIILNLYAYMNTYRCAIIKIINSQHSLHLKQ